MKRREFLRTTAAGVAYLGYASIGSGEALPQATPLRLGVVGPGSRGKELMRQFLRVPGVDVVAVCDVYEPRFVQAEELVRHSLGRYADYRRMLERKDLDAVVVATPPKLHAEIVNAALRSGRPVYGEKLMGFSVADSLSIVQTVAETKQIFQVGHEYRYASWFVDSIARIHAGEIGKVTHVYGYWHRNNDWRRPVPDPKLERLINWRLYKESSMGLLAELGSHMVDVANWVFGEMPESVLASGSIAEYHDGRETNDNDEAIYSYSGGRKFVFSALSNNAIVGNQIWVYGDKGSVQLTIEDAAFFYEAKKAIRPDVGVEKGVKVGASYRTGGEMPYRGEGAKVKITNPDDPTLVSCRAFAASVREGTRPLADERVGYASAVAIALGFEACEQERVVRFDKVKLS